LRETLNVEIRKERPGDIPAIRHVNQLAFGRDQEADMVDALRANGAAWLSLVATLNDEVVGHIMYSPLEIGQVRGAGLGPIAVHPEHQRQGIGSALIEAGNLQLREAGCPFVVVLGHADFYPRFGFRPARPLGISCEWDVPDDTFMVLALHPERMQGVSGLARYRVEFSMVS
jgi:putative acetyltransferase